MKFNVRKRRTCFYSKPLITSDRVCLNGDYREQKNTQLFKSEANKAANLLCMHQKKSQVTKIKQRQFPAKRTIGVCKPKNIKQNREK